MQDEQKLIGLAKEGDNEAFSQLAKRYRSLLYAAAYSVLHSRDDAEDAAQEALCRIYVKLQTFNEQGSFGRWAYVIAKNAAIARLRSVSRETPLDLMQAPAEEHRSSIAEEIKAAVSELPERLREPLLMYYVDGYAGREIASFLEIPAGTIRAQLTEARKLLRKELLPMLRRTLKDMVPESEVNRLLARLQALPKMQPDLKIVEVNAPLPDPDYLEAHWFFVPLEEDGEVVSGWYDWPERKLADHEFGRTLGKVTMAGKECWEVIGSGSPTSKLGNYRMMYWEIKADELELVAVGNAHDEDLMFSSDPNWGWSDLPPVWPRYPARLPLLDRVGDDEFVYSGQNTVVPVGAYDVSVNETEYRCLRVIQVPDNGALVEAYVNAEGRTILWRRYNAAPQWSKERLRGPYQPAGAVERLMDLGNHRLVFNGIEFYHWYDCMTDTVLNV